MTTGDEDRCPHCRQGLEIVVIRFASFGARAVTQCPNCALSPVEQRSLPTSPILSRLKMMITFLNERFKSIVAAALSAILVAGVLRHTLHVYAGISPADIRSDSLLLIAG